MSLFFPKTIDEFIASDHRSFHLKVDGFRLFVRKATHVVNGSRKTCFDVATIDLSPKYQKGNGRFKDFLPELIERLRAFDQFDGLYIENVFAENLQDFFRRYPGFVEEMFKPDFEGYPACFFYSFK